MEIEDKNWSTKFEQLNTRSRWYSSQLWYVPFAFIGIVGLSFEKVSNAEYPLNVLIFIIFGIFSISVFVHVSALKYYERRAVKSMQELENKVTSGGGSKWFISFAFYIRVMLLLASYFFIAYGIINTKLCDSWKWWILGITLTFLTILFIVIIWNDIKRNTNLRQEIVNNMKK